ncbi:hypothetical protein GpartN1_g420.t1 [Galdieria partita]|uniref:tRNA threonylcarbamoyladenosine biosynthesis protein TsaE n=1 Tax=Galdieria partita TaxID=83374 RepID=A0A9C7PR10_9RHOD|nr:hypothetical protein GpartN1_g420.t1 [Galdieria partita]
MKDIKSHRSCFLGEHCTTKLVTCSLRALQRREIEPVSKRRVKATVFRISPRRTVHTAVNYMTCCNSFSSNVVSKEIMLRAENETEQLASIVSANVNFGDIILLYGDFGSGKTTFARAFIRKILCDPSLIVPSPSYLLMNEYKVTREIQGEIKKFYVYHLDLWRIESSENLPPIDLQNILHRGACLIEWPAAIEKLLPYEKLVLRFSFFDGKRKVELSMFGPKWQCLQDHISNF